MEKIDIWFLIACISLMFLAVIGVMISVIDKMTSKEIGTKEVECYDRYSNEIIGERCINIIYCGIISDFLGLCKR